ncbi:MAG: putative transporter [Oligoflexia bacterium]|nr:putative transporter [Oligoflexia bacterium]
MWLVDIISGQSVAQAIIVIGLVAASGLAVGAIRAWGLSLGIAGVLFTGIAFGHFGLKLDPAILDFCREFGLILFVYTIGLQVGPGFFSSLRKQGLPLNIMAASTVILGSLIAIVLSKGFGASVPMAVGVLAGATTNTPSLAAAQQALQDLPHISSDVLKLPGLGYALAYPFGVAGVILSMLLLKLLFGVKVKQELLELEQLRKQTVAQVVHLSLEVKNQNLAGLTLSQVPTLSQSGVVISRIMQSGKRPERARAEHVINIGDILLAVGPKETLEQLTLIIGAQAAIDIRKLESAVVSRDILITESWPLGKTIDELDLGGSFGVTATRLRRADVQLPMGPAVRLQFGDALRLVGEEADVQAAAKQLGNSIKQLNYPRLIPVFIGILVGIAIGTYPIQIPGMPSAVRLGLAGGPLIAAILLSRLGHVGSLVWHMPASANFMMREMGIVLFLSCVGLKAGDHFLEVLLNGQALYWILGGVLITMLPLLIVGTVARLVYKTNYLSLCGLLAGSMTDPPALSFATSLTGSDEPSISYSTVYPLTMLLRVVFAQIVVICFS